MQLGFRRFSAQEYDKEILNFRIDVSPMLWEKRQGLGPRNDVLTTGCKVVILRGGQRIITIIAIFSPKQIF